MRRNTKTLMRIILIVAVALTIALPHLLTLIADSAAKSLLSRYGIDATVRPRFTYRWNKGPELGCSVRIDFRGFAGESEKTDWPIFADVGGGIGTYHAHVTLPETNFSERDPLIAKLTPSLVQAGISNLTASGRVALHACVERTRQKPVPVWYADAPIRLDTVGLTADGQEISAADIAMTPSASGIADHLDIAPLFLRAASFSADGFTLTNIHAAVRADLKSILVTEASAGTCGGKVSLYSLTLNPKNLNTRFTLLLDNIDAGELLAHIQGFSGTASGRLHGKVRLSVKEGGKAIRLSDAFLYSTPGETGKLKMDSPETVTDNLSLAGLDESARNNVADALSNLDYSVLRFDLSRLAGKEASLGIRIEGSATRDALTVPVNINLNINGDLEQLINTGLGYSDKLKGNSK